MDRYFIFYDQTILSTIFRAATMIGLQFVLYFALKGRYKSWMQITFFILFFAIFFIVGQALKSNAIESFIESKINSVVTDKIECKSCAYRCKLRLGITFFSDVQIGDSIVKEANTDSFYVYRKDPQVEIYQLVSRRKY
jgi:hypothetical protein